MYFLTIWNSTTFCHHAQNCYRWINIKASEAPSSWCSVTALQGAALKIGTWRLGCQLSPGPAKPRTNPHPDFYRYI